MTDSEQGRPDPGDRHDAPGDRHDGPDDAAGDRRDGPDDAAGDRHDAPGDGPAGPDNPAGSYQGPPATDPYRDWWTSGWDQPPVTEIPSAPESPWAAPDPSGAHQPGTQPGVHQQAAGLPAPGGYAAPGGYPAPGGYGTAFVPYPAPARRRRRPWILGVLAAVLLLVFGGGGLVAYQVLNGGGAQPEQAVPADAVAFFKVDLNPSASQKVNVARLLHRLPKLTGLTGSGDWRRQLFQGLAEDGSVPAGISYDRDVKPWLGERAAIAVLPDSASGTPEPLLVLQCTDQNKARTAFSRFGMAGGVDFLHGYAVIAPSQPLADQAVAAAKAASLAASPNYRADLGQLGASGVAGGWADLSAANGLAGSLAPTGVAANGLMHSGRVAFTIRATPNAIDLVGRFTGLTGTSRSVPAPTLGGLPANTAVAVSAGYDPAAIDRSWRQYQQLLDQSGPLFGIGGSAESPLADGPGSFSELEQQYGLNLPADLTTVLGDGVTVSVAAGNGAGPTAFAVQTHADGMAAVRVLDRIRSAAQAHDADFPLSYQAAAGGLVVTNDPHYVASLSGGAATLSSLPGFRSALPEVSGASIAAFVNIDAIVADMRANPSNSDDVSTLSAFRAVGLTVRNSGGSASLHVRLLAH